MAKFMKIDDWAEKMGWQFKMRGKKDAELYRNGVLHGVIPVFDGYVKLGK